MKYFKLHFTTIYLQEKFNFLADNLHIFPYLHTFGLYWFLGKIY